MDYGIGLYLGLVHQNIGGVEGDFIQLEYDNKEYLYVPLSSIGQIQKYIGSEGGETKSKLASNPDMEEGQGTGESQSQKDSHGSFEALCSA